MYDFVPGYESNTPLTAFALASQPASQWGERQDLDATWPEPFRNDTDKGLGRPMEELYWELGKRTGFNLARVGNRLFATKDHQVIWLDTAAQLFAWMRGQFMVDWKSGGGSLVSRQEFFEFLRTKGPTYEWIEPLPHFPPLPDAYYLHPDLLPGGTGRFEQLMARFRPASATDSALLRAMFLTAFWGGRGGSRPAFVITGPETDDRGGRGVGKSAAVEVLAELCGGLIDVPAGRGIEDVKTRLLSVGARGLRVVRIDNVKGHLDDSELEALITAPVISGRRLFRGEGQRPNTLVWAITANGAGLSRDLAQRCVVIRLARPEYRPGWKDETLQLVRDHRREILADISAELAKPGGVPDSAYSRWATWEQDVLAKVDRPDECLREILERQGAADADTGEAEEVAAEFCKRLRDEGHDPDRETVFIPSRQAAAWLKAATGQHRATNKATIYLGSLGLPELRKSKKDGTPGWCWRGGQSPFGTMTWLGKQHGGPGH